MSKFIHPDTTRIRGEKGKQSSVEPKSLKGTKPTLIMKGLSLLKGKKEKQSRGYPYWVTNSTYDIELNYSYEEKTKVRQTQSC